MPSSTFTFGGPDMPHQIFEWVHEAKAALSSVIWVVIIVKVKRLGMHENLFCM